MQLTPSPFLGQETAYMGKHKKSIEGQKECETIHVSNAKEISIVTN